MDLHSPLINIKGVGAKASESFAAANIHTVYDLINFLPKSYQDYSSMVDIANIKPGMQTIQATVVETSIKRVRRGMTIVTAVLDDKSGRVQAVWFNQPYRARQFKDGEEYLFSGIFEFRYNRYQLTNPSAEKLSDVGVSTGRIVPIYRAIHGLKSQLVRKTLVELKPYMANLPDDLPPELVAHEDLMPRSDAVLGLHFPLDSSDIKQSRGRVAFDEVFELMLAARLNKDENNKLKGYPIAFNKQLIGKFVQSLPYALTNAQRLAAWDILRDIEKSTPMNRLVQGDVGSGKTVVAGIAALQVVDAGYQVAIMAPTEILAKQHASTLADLYSGSGVNVCLLTSSVKGAKRAELYKQIAGGAVQIVVGTHAIIQDSVTYHNLGLIVVDEQHRFGVNQRQALLKKSRHMPHMLSMTATPIPRSLALTVYGELDISIIGERPAGRKPINTKIWSPNSRSQLYESIDRELAAGRQAYVVCNLIDDSENSEMRSVKAEYKRLNTGPFKHRSIGLLHGKMKPSEKQAIMQDFSDGKIDILVSTTVVEVGVDVPNATVILIEDADRFGLAQLHQLRGRVGRSGHQSYCYLMMSDSKAPSNRLRELEKSNDGFYLAEVDLELRGPGEIYGRAQHGDLNLQVASLADTKLIAKVRRAVNYFVQGGYDLVQYKELARRVEIYQRMTKLN